LNWHDFKALERYLRSKSFAARLQFWKRHVIAPALIVTALEISLPYWDAQHRGHHSSQDRLVLFAAFLVSWIASLLLGRWSTYKKAKHAGLFDQDFAVGLCEAGLWHKDTAGEGTTFWSAVKEVLDFRDHIFFILSIGDAIHVIPKQSFLTFEEASTFHQEALRLWQKHRASSQPASIAHQ